MDQCKQGKPTSESRGRRVIDVDDMGACCCWKSKYKELKARHEILEHIRNRLEDEKTSGISTNEKLKEDLNELKRGLDVLTKEKHDLIAKQARFQTENVNLKGQIATLVGVRQQNESLRRRLQNIEVDVKRKEQTFNSEVRKAHSIQSEKQNNEHRISQLEEELTRTEENYKSAEKEKHLLRCETEKLKKQLERLECKDRDDKHDAERNEKRVTELDTRNRALQREVGELRQENKRRKQESQTQQEENEKLRKQGVSVTQQKTSLEKSVFDLTNELSALKASSNARETSLTESHQREVERIRQSHKDYIYLKDKRHTDEKEEMQSQMEAFFKALNDENKVERNTVNKAVEQLAKTNTAMNQIICAAFQAYKARNHQTTSRQAVDPDEVD